MPRVEPDRGRVPTPRHDGLISALDCGVDLDPSLVAALALFLGAWAFAVRAITPALVARLEASSAAVRAETEAHATLRADLDRLQTERDTLARRVVLLETRIAHARGQHPET